MEIICVPAIVAIVYVLVEVYKKFIAKGREKWLNVIPLISAIIGGAIGVAIFFYAPAIIVATNWGMAIVVGMASGLSATGCNQIFKQLEKFGIEVKEPQAEQKDEDAGNGDE